MNLTFLHSIPNFNPEWVSIDIMGNSIFIDGTINHLCLDIQFPEGEPPIEGEQEPEGEVEDEPLAEGEGEQCIENPEGCRKPLGGVFEVGDDLCLCIPCPVSESSSFSWTKDDVPLADGERIFGVTERTLQILSLTLSDSRMYRCTYDTGLKDVAVFEAQVTVIEKIPVAGVISLALVLVTGGAWTLYSGKRRR